MKRKSLLFALLLALFMPWAANAQETVEIGTNGGTTTNSYLPGYTLYDNTLSEQIYTAEEVTMAGTISSIAFYNGGSAKSPTVTLYMVNTDQEAFSNTSDWLTVTSGDLVFEGSVTFTANEWTTIELDTPFDYDGTSNLGLVAHIHMNPYSSGLACRVFTSTSNCSMYAYRDNTVYDPTNPGVNGANRLAVKNQIKLEITPSSGPHCEKPETLVADRVTAHEATLTWEGGSGEYNVEVNGEIIESNWRDQAYTLRELDAATNYTVRVQSVCSDMVNPETGDPMVSGWKAVSFTTPCDAITTYPWTENFDSYTGTTSGSTNNLPQCYNYINGTTYSYYAGYPVIYNGSSNSANNHLRLYSYYTSYGSYTYTDQYAILPEMEGLRGMMLTLYAKAYNANSSFTVGMMTDPTDASTFVAIDTKTPSSSTYEKFTFILGEGNYVAFKMEPANSSSTYRGIYIDDLMIDEVPTCLEPTDLEFTGSTTTTATLSWTNGSDDQTAWQICLNGNENNLIMANSNPFTIENLDASSTYTAKVRAYCSETDQSYWSNVISFATECDVISTLPWSENFDAYTGTTSTSAPTGYPNDQLPNCWQFLNRSETSSAYPQAFLTSSTTYAVSGNCLFFKSSSTTPLYAILPGFAEEIAGLQLTFTYRNEGVSTSNGTLIVGYMTDPADATTFTEVLTCDRTTTKTEKEVLFADAPTGSYIAFEYQGGSANNYYLGIDNVSVDYAPSCLKPQSLAVTANSVTAHEATITWTSDAAAWQVQLNDGDPIDVEETTYTFENLTPETAYTAKVRANCDGTYSEWSNTVSFTTTIACPAPTNLTVTPDLLNATFTWESNAGEWEVAFATDATAEPEEFIVGTVNEATYTVRDLELDGDYYFWVRANCGDEDGDSQWAGPASVHIGYCVPAPSNVDGNGISNVTFGMGDNIVNNDTPKATYADYSSQIGAVQAGVESTIAITYATGYTYGTIIWVDLDNNLSFEDSEIVYTGTSGNVNPTTLNAAITIPATQTPGDYMMRIGGADSGFDSYISNPSSTVPSACYNGSWACFQDYTLRVLEAPSCLPAGDVTVDPERITSTSAVISWTNNNGAEATYTVMQGETVLTTTAVDSYELTGLTAATSYPAGTFTIISNCDETAIANVPAFSTLCDVITDLPWSQNFEGFNNNTVPMCWDNSASTSLAAGTSQDYYIWGVVTVDDNNMIKMENYWAQTGTALINTPTIELPAEGAYQLSFDYAHNATCGAFAVNVSTDNGTTFTELASYTKGSGSSHTEPGDFTPATISLADYAGESIILQFFANANYGNGAIFVDNIKIQEVVTVTLDIDGVGEDDWNSNNNSGYYLIASPMMDAITPSANNGFITEDFDLYYFDEEMEGLEWRNYQVESFNIVPGKGYIYASKTDTQLKFTGVPNTNGEVTLTLQKTDGNAFEGWNLVGNPFNQTAYLPAGHTFYTMDYDQNLIVEVSQGDERNIEAMQAVFVVAEEDGETITFSTTAPEAKSAMVALNLNNRNGLIDRAIIRFDEGSTMPKLQLKRNSTKLYIPQDGNDYAVVRSEGMGAMPVNFKAESNGSYTITLSTEEVSFAYLHLIDKVANTDVDLLANPSYSFDALTTDFANRFELVFATSNSSDEDNFAFFNNGSFVINNSGDATLQVIDVNGRVLTSESINGCANVNVNAAAGVYMIRLVNGDNVKVQKVVVR